MVIYSIVSKTLTFFVSSLAQQQSSKDAIIGHNRYFFWRVFLSFITPWFIGYITALVFTRKNYNLIFDVWCRYGKVNYGETAIFSIFFNHSVIEFSVTSSLRRSTYRNFSRDLQVTGSLSMSHVWNIAAFSISQSLMAFLKRPPNLHTTKQWHDLWSFYLHDIHFLSFVRELLATHKKYSYLIAIIYVLCSMYFNQ